jgi:hypothetical protein
LYLHHLCNILVGQLVSLPIIKISVTRHRTQCT